MTDLTRSRRAGAANSGSNLIRLVVFLALSCLSFVGEGQEKAGDAKPDLSDVRAEAEKGDAQAEFDLGVIYYDGTGVEQDFTEATKWFRKAAEQGLAEAQFILG